MGTTRARRHPAGGGQVGPVSEPELLSGLGELVDLLGGESTRSRTFIGGLIAGALVGAAIAGTSLVRRRLTRR